MVLEVKCDFDVVVTGGEHSVYLLCLFTRNAFIVKESFQYNFLCIVNYSKIIRQMRHISPEPGPGHSVSILINIRANDSEEWAVEGACTSFPNAFRLFVRMRNRAIRSERFIQRKALPKFLLSRAGCQRGPTRHCSVQTGVSPSERARGPRTLV